MPRVNLPRECEPWELDLALEIVTSPRHSRLPYSTDAKLCLCGARPALDLVPRLPHGAFRVASPVRPKPPIPIINIHRFPLFNIVKQAYCQDSCAPRVSQCQSIHDPYTPIFPRLIAARRPY